MSIPKYIQTFLFVSSSQVSASGNGGPHPQAMGKGACEARRCKRKRTSGVKRRRKGQAPSRGAPGGGGKWASPNNGARHPVRAARDGPPSPLRPPNAPNAPRGEGTPAMGVPDGAGQRTKAGGGPDRPQRGIGQRTQAAGAAQSERDPTQGLVNQEGGSLGG